MVPPVSISRTSLEAIDGGRDLRSARQEVREAWKGEGQRYPEGDSGGEQQRLGMAMVEVRGGVHVLVLTASSPRRRRRRRGVVGYSLVPSCTVPPSSHRSSFMCARGDKALPVAALRLSPASNPIGTGHNEKVPPA